MAIVDNFTMAEKKRRELDVFRNITKRKYLVMNIINQSIFLSIQIFCMFSKKKKHQKTRVRIVDKKKNDIKNAGTDAFKYFAQRDQQTFDMIIERKMRSIMSRERLFLIFQLQNENKSIRK